MDKRSILIGVAVGVAIIGLIIYGVLNMGQQFSGNLLTGRIAEKELRPLPATEITIGKGRVRSKRVEGDYVFQVYVEAEKRTYTVWVDKVAYYSKRVGDIYRFPPPAPEKPAEPKESK